MAAASARNNQRQMVDERYEMVVAIDHMGTNARSTETQSPQTIVLVSAGLERIRRHQHWDTQGHGGIRPAAVAGTAGNQHLRGRSYGKIY